MGRFFLWCAGAREDWLEPGPERQRFVTMGASIVLAGVLAAVSMWVLTGYVLPDAGLAVRIGASALWAAVVFVLDRTIAVVMVSGGAFRRMLAYLPRLAFALIAAFLVSEPLVLAVYDKEVTQHIHATADASRPARIEAASQEPRFIAPDDVVLAAEGRIEVLQEEIRSLDARSAEEARGEGATGEVGCGRVCLGFRAERVEAQRELDGAQQALVEAQADRETRQEELDAARNASVDADIAAIKTADGIAARHTALTDYLEASPGAMVVRWAIAAVLLLADLAVVLFKLVGAEPGHDKRERHRLRVLARRLDHEMAAIEERSAADAKARVAADAGAQVTIEAWERADRLRRAGLRYRHVSGYDSGTAQDEPDREDPTPVDRVGRGAGGGRRGGPGGTGSEPGPGTIVPGSPGKGPYELEQQIGSGGYGTVFRARDLQDGTKVAVKFIKAEDKDSWRREVATTSQLDHQHIATVLDVPQFNDEWLCVVYPLYRPGSLADVRSAERLRPSRKLSLGYALSVADQILYALSQAHDHGIVHRDIKPGNILLDRNNVRVSDFGRAHSQLDSSRSPALADWKWTAPEVVAAAVGMEPDPSDSRSDLYSTAAVLYWLITGEAPLVREMAAEAIRRGPIGRQMAERRKLVSERVDHYDDRIPHELASLLAQWLHRDPTMRGAPDTTSACRAARNQLAALLDALPDRSRLNRIEIGRPWPPAAAAAPPPGRGPTAAAPDEGETPYE